MRGIFLFRRAARARRLPLGILEILSLARPVAVVACERRRWWHEKEIGLK